MRRRRARREWQRIREHLHDEACEHLRLNVVHVARAAAWQTTRDGQPVEWLRVHVQNGPPAGPPGAAAADGEDEGGADAEEEEPSGDEHELAPSEEGGDDEQEDWTDEE